MERSRNTSVETCTRIQKSIYLMFLLPISRVWEVFYFGIQYLISYLLFIPIIRIPFKCIIFVFVFFSVISFIFVVFFDYFFCFSHFSFVLFSFYLFFFYLCFILLRTSCREHHLKIKLVHWCLCSCNVYAWFKAKQIKWKEST